MNLNKNWDLQIDEAVHKELKKFPSKYSQKITEIIESLSPNPYLGDIQKIKGEKNIWRRRSGAYRIFYEMNQEERTIHVFWVERRGSKTY